MKKEMIDFKTFKRSIKPNNYLACPEGYCHAKTDEISASYPVDLKTLHQAWKTVITNEPRTTIIKEAPDYFQVVQISLIFRFRDYVHIKLLADGSRQSTFALYSYSKLGYSDLGVNEKRGKRWISALEKKLES